MELWKKDFTRREFRKKNSLASACVALSMSMATPPLFSNSINNGGKPAILGGNPVVTFHLFSFRYKSEALKDMPRASFLKALRAEGICPHTNTATTDRSFTPMGAGPRTLIPSQSAQKVRAYIRWPVL